MTDASTLQARLAQLKALNEGKLGAVNAPSSTATAPKPSSPFAPRPVTPAPAGAHAVNPSPVRPMPTPALTPPPPRPMPSAAPPPASPFAPRPVPPPSSSPAPAAPPAPSVSSIAQTTHPGLHAAPAALSPKPAGAAPAAAPPALPPLNKPQLTEAQFQFFAKLVYELSGMRFEANKSYFLASKVDQRVQALALKDFDAYIAYLNTPQGRPEYGHLIDEVSINETFFFRHEPQLQSFRHDILTPLAQARRVQGKTTLRIWSAASSTGDELYTLALMLRDAGLWGKDLTWELVGTDICHDALERARAGVYRKYNIRNVPPALLQAHFTHDPSGPTGETWQLKPDIRSTCRFVEGNLMDSARCSALGKFDLIFCRNVLIYFDEPSKEKAVQNLANNLTEDGFVLLGHSENIYSQRHILRPNKEYAAAIAYQKAPPGTPKL